MIILRKWATFKVEQIIKRSAVVLELFCTNYLIFYQDVMGIGKIFSISELFFTFLFTEMQDVVQNNFDKWGKTAFKIIELKLRRFKFLSQNFLKSDLAICNF